MLIWRINRYWLKDSISTDKTWIKEEIKIDISEHVKYSNNENTTNQTLGIQLKQRSQEIS